MVARGAGNPGKKNFCTLLARILLETFCMLTLAIDRLSILSKKPWVHKRHYITCCCHNRYDINQKPRGRLIIDFIVENSSIVGVGLGLRDVQCFYCNSVLNGVVAASLIWSAFRNGGKKLLYMLYRRVCVRIMGAVLEPKVISV